MAVIATTAFEDLADKLGGITWLRAPGVLAMLAAQTYEEALLANPLELMELCEAAGLFRCNESGEWEAVAERIRVLTPNRDALL